MMTFDLNSHIVSDFTQDKRQIMEGINELANEVYHAGGVPGDRRLRRAHESLDRMSRIEGQKYILLVASGVDSMSKLTWTRS